MKKRSLPRIIHDPIAKKKAAPRRPQFLVQRPPILPEPAKDAVNLPDSGPRRRDSNPVDGLNGSHACDSTRIEASTARHPLGHQSPSHISYLLRYPLPSRENPLRFPILPARDGRPRRPCSRTRSSLVASWSRSLGPHRISQSPPRGRPPGLARPVSPPHVSRKNRSRERLPHLALGSAQPQVARARPKLHVVLYLRRTEGPNSSAP